MKPMILTLALMMAAMSGTYAQGIGADPMRPAKAAERQAAIGSVQAQLKAFARDDYPAATRYQSSALKKNFASPNAFRAMMLRVYPEFTHAKSVQFGPARCDLHGIHLILPAAVSGQDGITVRALYWMVREGKSYRVEGVQGGAQAPADNFGETLRREI